MSGWNSTSSKPITPKPPFSLELGRIRNWVRIKLGIRLPQSPPKLSPTHRFSSSTF
ncbi:hypothetical protein LguiA_020187 [Lonicera macranthoides]